MNGKLDQAGEVFQFQLFFEVFTVGADSLDTEVESLGDLFGGIALADQAQHFEFTVRKDIQG